MRQIILCCLGVLFVLVFSSCTYEKTEIFRTSEHRVLIRYTHDPGFLSSNSNDIQVDYLVYLPGHLCFEEFEGFLNISHYPDNILLDIVRDGPSVRGDCGFAPRATEDDQYNTDNSSREVCELAIFWRRKLELDTRVPEIIESPPAFRQLEPPQ